MRGTPAPRRWLRPRRSPGRYLSARFVVGWALILIFVVIPHLRINDKPVILLDVVHRQFLPRVQGQARQRDDLLSKGRRFRIAGGVGFSSCFILVPLSSSIKEIIRWYWIALRHKSARGLLCPGGGLSWCCLRSSLWPHSTAGHCMYGESHHLGGMSLWTRSSPASGGALGLRTGSPLELGEALGQAAAYMLEYKSR